MGKLLPGENGDNCGNSGGGDQGSGCFALWLGKYLVADLWKDDHIERGEERKELVLLGRDATDPAGLAASFALGSILWKQFTAAEHPQYAVVRDWLGARGESAQSSVRAKLEEKR